MESDKTSQVPQTGVADTPPSADMPRTEAGSDRGNLMDFLDIPADVQGQLKPREVAPELTGDVPIPPEETESPPPTGEQPSRDEEVGEEEPEEEPEPEPAAAPEEQPKLDKRQKRINRLTRQKSKLQTKLDTAYRQAEEMRQQLEQIQGKQQEAAGAAPP